MKNFNSLYSFAVILIFCSTLESKKSGPLKFFWDPSNSLEISARMRVEGFYGKNSTLLNDANGQFDKIIIPVKHTLDMAAIYGNGCSIYGFDIIRMKTALRTKSTWGAPETIASTDFTGVKDVDTVFGNHAHTINKHVIWVREMWFEALIPELLGWHTNVNKHGFTIGFFPFQLGRGIALGDSYATDPDIIGFYYPAVVDQYTPGFKLFGICADERVLYDFYTAILYNRSHSFDNVNMRVRGQEFGHRFLQGRGFGVINWLAALRLKLYPIKMAENFLVLEPYVLYDDEREQKIEFLGDASTKLITLGFAAEAKYGNFEFGFDCAKNFGKQFVKGWDRNVIMKEVRNGTFVESNSDVFAITDNGPDVAGSRALYIPANQAIINTALQDDRYNNQQIGGSNLKNGPKRFSNAYQNVLKGLMCVGDISYNFCPCLKFAVTGGLATGDENPNRDIDDLNDSNMDGDYKGFIGLQENYSGLKVRSAFFLNGAGKVPRILSFPEQSLSEKFPSTVYHFTNIVFIGASLFITADRWTINPNVLNFWQEHATRIFSQTTEQFVTDRFARKWLGLEWNLFLEYQFYNDIKLFFVGALFAPGTAYSDIKGLPLNKEQAKFLDTDDVTGITTEFVPTLGNNRAYTFNMGIDYKF